MTTGLRFSCGASKIEVTGDPYVLDSFLPPPVLPTYVMGGGAMNPYSGAEVINEKLNNRQMVFSIQVKGASASAVLANLDRLDEFFALYRDQRYPLFIDYAPVPGLPEPYWGTFGAWRRYEVASIIDNLTDAYQYAFRSERVIVRVTAQVKPLVSLPTPQAPILAAGAVLPGMTGIRASRAYTNTIGNPVFGNDDWDYGWTATNLTAQVNTDPAYVLPGARRSAYLYALENDGSFTYPVTVGWDLDTFLLAYVKRADGAPVTAADCELNWGGAYPAEYLPAGDGWYLLYAFISGGDVEPAGLTVKAGRGLYLGGVGAQEVVRDQLTPLIWGSLPGCKWDGEPHASSSTAAQGAMELVDAALRRFAVSGGLFVSLRADMDSDTEQGDFLIAGGESTMGLFFADSVINPGTRYFALQTYPTSLSVTNVPFSIGDTVHIAASWGAAGAALNVHNVTTGVTGAASTATASVLNLGDTLTLASLNGMGGTFDDNLPFLLQDLAIYPRQLSSAEMTAVLDEAANLPARAPRLPVLWTPAAGPGRTLKNALDSNNYNAATLYGVPGSYPPAYSIGGVQTGLAVTNHLSVSPSATYAPPNLFYNDLGASGDGVSDSGCSGGYYKNFTIGTTETAVNQAVADPTVVRDAVLGRNWYVFVRLKDTSNTSITGRARFIVGSQIYTSDLVTLTTVSSEFRIYRLGPVNLPALRHLYDSPLDTSATMQFAVLLKRPSGSAALSVDFVQAVPAPLAYLGGYGSTTYDSFLLTEEGAFGMANAYTQSHVLPVVKGDDPVILPGQFNHIVQVIGAHGAAHAINSQCIYDFFVTPRWGLL
jgi:hypothetical protein